MAWQAITDADLQPGVLIFSRVWASLVANPDAVHAGDTASVPPAKRILIESQASPASGAAGQFLLCYTGGALLQTDNQQITDVAPFVSFDVVGTTQWVVPVSAWYEVQVHGGGAGGLAVAQGNNTDSACSPDGGLLRVAIFLLIGSTLDITVGNGGGVGFAGNPSLVSTGAGLLLFAGGGPLPTNYNAPHPTADLSFNGGAQPLCQQPGIATGIWDTTNIGDDPSYLCGGGCVGQGGPATLAGRRGCVTIERISFGG